MKFQLNEQGINALLQQSHTAIKKTAHFLESRLRQEIPVDTWITRASIHTIKVASNRYLVGSNEWSAYVMEYWRKPWSSPNLDASVWWTARKIGSGQVTKKYDELKWPEGRELKNIIYVIARSIANNGIAPKKIFTKAREKYQRDVEQYFYFQMKNNAK